MIVLIPNLRTASVMNAREHWQKRAERSRRQRMEVTIALVTSGAEKCSEGVVILSRIAPYRLDDDNLTGALKSARDAVAQWLGIDDKSPLIDWRYAQRKGTKPREYGVEVRFQTKREWAEMEIARLAQEHGL